MRPWRCRVIAAHAAARRPGLLEGALLKLLTRSATVASHEVVADRFHLLTLQGDELRGVRWTPGDKVQVVLSPWVHRTYTPMSWDAQLGVTRLLAYAHGESPGAIWARSAEEGDQVKLFGPRGSLELPARSRPALVVGDETSFALAHALSGTDGGLAEVDLVFEVDDVDASEMALERIGVGTARLVARRPGDSHLGQLESFAIEAARAGAAHHLLTGKATSIQRVKRALRAAVGRAASSKSKAYWAPGRTGLD
jgi:ferric-chelate reductase (NADPH)